MKRCAKTAMAWIGVVVSVCILASCRHTSDEAQIRTSIAAVATAAQAADAGRVVAPLSKDFDGNGGELDRSALGNMVRLLRLRDEHVGVTMGPVTIEHRGERMVSTFVVTLTSTGQRLLPDRIGVFRVEAAWRRESGAWYCYSARWKRSL